MALTLFIKRTQIRKSSSHTAQKICCKHSLCKSRSQLKLSSISQIFNLLLNRAESGRQIFFTALVLPERLSKARHVKHWAPQKTFLLPRSREPFFLIYYTLLPSGGITPFDQMTTFREQITVFPIIGCTPDEWFDIVLFRILWGKLTVFVTMYVNSWNIVKSCVNDFNKRFDCRKASDLSDFRQNSIVGITETTFMQAFHGVSLTLLGFRTATSIQILELFSSHPGMIRKRFSSINKNCTKIFRDAWCSIISPQLFVRDIHFCYKIRFLETPLSNKVELTQKESAFQKKLVIFIRRSASDVIFLYSTIIQYCACSSRGYFREVNSVRTVLQ